MIEGVPELVRTAALGLQILGNSHDVVELRKVEAMLALRTGAPEGAVRILTGVLDDPVLGGPGISLGGVRLILGHALAALDRQEAARAEFATAALQFEEEGRLLSAVDAWRLSAGQKSSTEFLTRG